MNGYRRRLQGRIGRWPRRADGRLRGIAPSVVGHGGELQNHASDGHRISGGWGPELGITGLGGAKAALIPGNRGLP